MGINKTVWVGVFCLLLQACGASTRTIRVQFPSSVPPANLMKQLSSLATSGTIYANCDQTKVFAWIKPVGAETFLKSGRLDLKSKLSGYGLSTPDPVRFGFNTPAVNFEVPSDRPYEIGIAGMVYGSSFYNQAYDTATDCAQLDYSYIQNYFISGKVTLQNDQSNYTLPIFIAPMNMITHYIPTEIPYAETPFRPSALQSFEPSILVNRISGLTVGPLVWRMYLAGWDQPNQVVDIPLVDEFDYLDVYETYFPSVPSRLVLGGVELDHRISRCRGAFLTGYLMYLDVQQYFRAPKYDSVAGQYEMGAARCDYD